MRRRIVTLGTRPEFWLTALLVWATLSALRSAGTPWARAALTEWLRWGAGIGLTLALGGGLRRTRSAARGLTAALGILALIGVAEGSGGSGVLGPYRDHQLCGSALLVLLPFAAAVGLTAHAPGWRWGGQAAALAGLACLVLTQTRSAWAGAAVAGGVFAALWWRQTRARQSHAQRRMLLVPLLLATGVGVIFAAMLGTTELRGPLESRAGTLTRLARDQSWQGRLTAWRGAARMVAAQPVFGWGLGRYPGAQWRFTQVGRPLGPRQQPSLSEQAHSLYLQTTAELGLVGLGLYGAALASLCLLGGQTLRQQTRRGPPDSRTALTIALLSVSAGQAVDALASPSWQFGEVSLLFWAALGVGLAATRRAAPEPAAVRLPIPLSRPLRLAAVGGATLVGLAQFFPLGFLRPVEAYTTPPATWTYVGVALTTADGRNTYSVQSDQQITFVLTAHYRVSGQPDQYPDVTLDGPPNSFYGASGGRSAFMGGGNTGSSRNVLVLSGSDAGKTLTVAGTFYANGVSKFTSTTIKITP